MVIVYCKQKQLDIENMPSVEFFRMEMFKSFSESEQQFNSHAMTNFDHWFQSLKSKLHKLDKLRRGDTYKNNNHRGISNINNEATVLADYKPDHDEEDDPRLHNIVYLRGPQEDLNQRHSALKIEKQSGKLDMSEYVRKTTQRYKELEKTPVKGQNVVPRYFPKYTKTEKVNFRDATDRGTGVMKLGGGGVGQLMQDDESFLRMIEESNHKQSKSEEQYHSNQDEFEQESEQEQSNENENEKSNTYKSESDYSSYSNRFKSKANVSALMEKSFSKFTKSKKGEDEDIFIEQSKEEVDSLVLKSSEKVLSRMDNFFDNSEPMKKSNFKEGHSVILFPSRNLETKIPNEGDSPGQNSDLEEIEIELEIEESDGEINNKSCESPNSPIRLEEEGIEIISENERKTKGGDKGKEARLNVLIKHIKKQSLRIMKETSENIKQKLFMKGQKRACKEVTNLERQLLKDVIDHSILQLKNLALKPGLTR